MHHCIVKIRIKFLANRFNRFYANLFECSHQLFVNLLHSFCKRVGLFFLRYSRDSSFEVIHNRKNLFYDIFRTDFVHLRFFFVCTLAEVIKLCHLTSESVSQFLNLLVFFIFFVLTTKFLHETGTFFCLFLF